MIRAGFFCGAWDGRTGPGRRFRFLYHYPITWRLGVTGHLFILSFYFFTFRFAWRRSAT